MSWPSAQIWRKSRIDYCNKSFLRLRDIFKVSRRMVADKYIKPYISGSRRELPTQWCWNGLCSMHMDEVVSRWRRRKKIIIKKDIVNSTFSLFYLHTNPQVCHICSEWNLPNSFLEIMRHILQEYVFRVWSYTFLNECCRAFEKNYISVRYSLTLLIINIF